MCKVFGGLPLPLLLEGCSDELSGSLLGSVSEGGGVYCSAVGGLPGGGEAILMMLEKNKLHNECLECICYNLIYLLCLLTFDLFIYIYFYLLSLIFSVVMLLFVPFFW